MQATQWEFKNRAMLFGMIVGVTFPLYMLDQQNSAAALANWLGPRLRMEPDLLARCLFALAAMLLAVAALIRTWASAYLQADVVYAAEVKTESVVADGPYRHVRNPLYFANVLMAVSMGAMMSRVGLVAVIILTWVFCYRLIWREEAELQASQGASYEGYRQAVPRFLPSPWPRTASAGRSARWSEGFKAEAWFWGFALAIAAFAMTLKFIVFIVIVGASIVWLFVGPALLDKKPNAEASEKP
jgi:protein-S-isoprenylcysteine O-methyltransferase Ste14